MKSLTKNILTCLLISISLVFSVKQDDSSVIKKPKFLDGVKSDNHEAQLRINELKKDFYNEKQEIQQSYENKIKLIKKNRKEDLVELKKKYRRKLRKLRKRYPDIPDIKIDSSPRPKLTPPNLDKKNKKIKMRDRKKDKKLPKK